MKIFYSWQMDSSRKTNKNFIKNCLDAAVKNIQSEVQVSDAPRNIPTVEIAVDQDTQGVLGSPPIAQVIFEKIKNSDVVVVDVTLVANGNDKKKHINSNVAIELGYALGISDYTKLLKIMNTAEGGPDQLPFDLRANRHPLQYRLDGKSTAKDFTREKTRIVGELSHILRLYIERQATQTSDIQTAPLHKQIDPEIGVAKFWPKGRTLVEPTPRYNRTNMKCERGAITFCRCIPLEALDELSSKDCLDMARELIPMHVVNGWSHERNQWGAITFDGNNKTGELYGGFQIFRNRELWGFEQKLLSERYEMGNREQRRYIPSIALFNDIPRAIDKARTLSAQLYGGNEYKFVLGMDGIQGYHIAVHGMRKFNTIGPIHLNHVYIDQLVTPETSTVSLFNAFVEKLFSEAGGEATVDYLIKDEHL